MQTERERDAMATNKTAPIDYQSLLRLTFVRVLVERQLAVNDKYTLRLLEDEFYIENKFGSLHRISKDTMANNHADIRGILDACHFYRENVDDPYAFFFEDTHTQRTFSHAFLLTLYVDKPDIHLRDTETRSVTH